jgi:hypothetical protein
MQTRGGPVPFGAAGETQIHPAVLVALIVALILVLTLRRRYVVVPLLVLSLVIPYGQVVMIGPVHFMVVRILALLGWARLIIQRFAKEAHPYKIRFNSVDKAVVLYTVTATIGYTLLWQQSAALVNQLGEMYNVLGFYFLFRFFIRDQRDSTIVIKALAITSTIVAMLMVNELSTGRNVLAGLGGLPDQTIMRQGYLRAQGPFRVYVTAGVFGAVLLPLFLSLWRKGGSRVLAILGVIAGITIAVTSRTSTALLTCVAAALGVALWMLRDQMKPILWGLVAMLVGLHLAMKAPVWALLARIDLVGGSTGWHRYKIIDNFITHFWDWCWFGSTNYWTWPGGDDMWDLANQYVLIGESKGLLPLLCFVATIVYCFKYLSRARRAAGPDLRRTWWLWLLSTALFANVVAFFGISYFDQSFVCWYALLAMIIAATTPYKAIERTGPLLKPFEKRPIVSAEGIASDRIFLPSR